MQKPFFIAHVLTCALTLSTTAIAQTSQQITQLPGGISPSPTTTYVTGPARSPEGIDFIAAINLNMKEGVTPENNADVLLLQAVGMDIFPSLYSRDQYLLELGIEIDGIPFDSPPEPKFIQEEIRAASSRPWAKSEFPDLVKWLQQMETPLKLTQEATTRPKFYSPLVLEQEDTDHPRTIAAVLPTIQAYRNLGKALVCRAMLRTQQGEIDAAGSDLMTCFRLARLLRHHPTPLGCLTAIAMELSAAKAMVLFAHAGNLKAEEARRFRDEFNQLPALAPLADKYNYMTRLTAIESACYLARLGIAKAGNLTMDSPGSPIAAGAFRTVEKSMNWNQVLNFINQQYDHDTQVLTHPTYEERKEAVEKLTAQRAILRADLKRLATDINTRQLRPETAIVMVIDQIAGLPLQPFFTAQEHLNARLDQVPIALALAEFRNKNGDYPQALQELAPDMLNEIPADHYSGEALEYQNKGDGYKLFAMGPDMEDDFGKDASQRDDIGIDTSQYKVVSRFKASELYENETVQTVGKVVIWGVIGLLLVIVGVVGWKFIAPKKKPRRKSRTRRGSSSRSTRGLPPRRPQRRNR